MAGKKELTNEVQELLVGKDIKINKADLGAIVDAVFEGALITTKKYGKLKLIGFGNFEIRERKARKGRNPQTSEEIDIPAKKVPAWKPAKAFKDAVL